MTEHPIISLQKTDYTQIGGSQEYRLMATSYGSTTPAGPRLFRSPPHPDIRFVHDFEDEAKKDAATLTAYITATWPTKSPSKASLRKKVEARA